MQQFSEDTIEAVARVMADSFLDDPMNRAILEGVDEKEALILAHSRIHTQHAVRTGTLTLLDGNPGAFIIGLDSKDQSRLRDLNLIAKIYIKTFQILSFRDIKRILQNNKKVGTVLSFSWQKDLIKSRYYRVKIVAIDKSMRGKGAFRRLITPILELSDTENVPLILETHNAGNLGIYQKFGFELVKTINSPTTEIQQYCMIRWPVIAA